MSEKEKSEQPEQTVQKLITAAGTTQAKIAHKLNVSTNTVNAWLMRRKIPRADNFLALCREMNLSPKKLALLLRLDVTNIPDDLPQCRSPNEEVN